MSGETVKIFLVDGHPSKIMTAEILGWTGKFTVLPRTQLKELGQREEVKRTGVYILVGENPEDPIQEMVYIGESDNVWKRLTQHSSDASKGFWRRTVIIVSKDENINKAHILYLESRLIQIATQTNRVKVVNDTNPVKDLSESDIAYMESFLEKILMLLPTLGFNFALPLPTPEITEEIIGIQVESPRFHLTHAGVDAYAQEINGEFVVLKDSTARKLDTPSLTSTYIQIRQELVANGKLANSTQPDYWIFTQSVPFSSPSAAANTVTGTRLNGRLFWKVEDSSDTYADWQQSQVEVESLEKSE